MNLSELVKFKTILEQTQSDIRQELEKNLTILETKNILESLSPIDFTYRENLVEFFKNLDSEKSKLNHNLYLQIKELEKLIDEKANNFKNRGYTVNGLIACAPMPPEEERLSRFYMVDPDLKNIIKSIISLKTDPKFPTLEVGPGDGFWTEYLVAADPLYIIDIHDEFLKSTVDRFPESYRMRIRPYLWVEDNIKDHYLEQLPQNQFGFVFAFNVFDFFTPDFFESYLIGVYNILKPGGSILLTYNNCDYYNNARLAEIGYKSWMPKSLLDKIAVKLGFQIEQHNSLKNTHWCILRKPGSLTSVKVTQSLGKIIRF